MASDTNEATDVSSLVTEAVEAQGGTITSTDDDGTITVQLAYGMGTVTVTSDDRDVVLTSSLGTKDSGALVELLGRKGDMLQWPAVSLDGDELVVTCRLPWDGCRPVYVKEALDDIVVMHE